jgi:hypothetical protein
MASWIVPLFILIGLMQYSPLGRRNTIAVVLHMLGDPINHMAHLLWKLHNTTEFYDLCQTPLLPHDVQRPAAMILSATEEWENVWYAEILRSPASKKARIRASMKARVRVSTEARVRVFSAWYRIDPQAEQTKLTACLKAANNLTECRVSGLWKTSLGVLNYVVAVALAFLHIINGDYDNRIGHSIAFAMLYSWLIPTVFLSSLVGCFQTKRSSIRVLLDLLEETRGQETRSAGFLGHSFDKDIQTVDYGSLEWCGGNYSFSPSQFRQGGKRRTLVMIATIPVTLSALSAAFISFFNPTRGIGCRTVLQFIFFLTWILSAILTDLLGSWKVNDARLHWRLTLIKDAVFVLPQFIVFSLAHVGWFNSCFCWSAQFSLREAVYVVLNPMAQILSAAKFQWPILTGVILVSHFVFIGAVWVYYRQAVHLYQS